MIAATMTDQEIMENELKKIGLKIREEILNRSSILEFSKSVNVSRRTIHTIIKGDKPYNINNLILICDELGIEIDLKTDKS